MNIPALRRRTLNRGHAFVGLIALLAVTACAGEAPLKEPEGAQKGQDWSPSGPIQLVVPYPAGGGTDTVARTVAPFLEDELGTPVNVVIHSGGAGTAGALYVKSQDTDGTTILMGESGVMTTGPLANPNTPYDPGKDFVGVAQVTSNPWILAASEKSQIDKMQDLTDLSPTDAKGVDVGIAGILSSDHYAFLLLQRELGFPEYTTVAYGGGGPKAKALLAGEVDLIMDTYEGIRAGLEDERVVPLALCSDERSDSLPEVPTTVELGYDKVVASLWQGLMVKAGTPSNAVGALESALHSVTKNPKWRKRVTEIGLDPKYLGGKEFNQKMRQERKNAKELMKSLDKSAIKKGSGS